MYFVVFWGIIIVHVVVVVAFGGSGGGGGPIWLKSKRKHYSCDEGN